MNKLIYIILPLTLLSCRSNDNAIQFQALHESLLSQQKTLESENTRIYREMENKRHAYSAQAKALFWQPKVDDIKKLSITIKNYISELETDMKKVAEASTNSHGQSYYKHGSAPVKHLFDEKGKSVELFKKLSQYKNSIIEILKPNEFSGNPVLQKNLARYASELQLLILDYIDSSNNPNSTKTNPISGYFKGMSVIAALTMISKVKNDVLCAEHTILNLINNMVTFHDESYESFSAIVTQSSNNLKAGEQLTVYAGIGAFSQALKPMFTINGVSVPANDNGVSTYKSKITGKPGYYSIPVKIEFIKPDGSHATSVSDIKYTVLNR